jgi:thiol peroxidase
MSTITLKGNAIRINGTLPKLGSVAPDFVLVDQELNNRTLKDFHGKKLLAIVPSLDTSVCLTSAKKFNEKMSSLPHVTLLYISADLPFAQKRACGAENLKKIQMLSMMRDKKFAIDYGILIEDGPLAGICARAMVGLNEKNQVIYTELVPEITTEPDYARAIASV